MDNNNSANSAGLGNTKAPQIAVSKNWCFTLNNWTEEQKDKILLLCANSAIIKSYVFQAEIGKEGTNHLQGYIEFVKRDRPKSLFNIDQIHWEKCKSPKASIAYCSKSDTSTGQRWTNLNLPKPLKIITELYQWQKDIVEIIKKEPDNRSIYWYWESVGGIGKTQFCKYLVVHHNAIILGGKGADCKYAIIKYEEKHGVYPELIIYDVSRSTNDYISYDSLESIKNGLFFSNKYESAQVIMNSPHLICFANEEPDTSKMSADRWKIYNIGESNIINPLDG